MIPSCPNYLHAEVSDGEDLSRHQQKVTGGQLVTMSLVPGTVDSEVASKCHLCCPPPLPAEEVSSLDGSSGPGLCALLLPFFATPFRLKSLRLPRARSDDLVVPELPARRSE